MDELVAGQQGLGDTQSQEMDPRQRVAMALQMQKRIGKQHPLGQAVNNAFQAWNMRRPMPSAAPVDGMPTPAPMPHPIPSQAFSGQGANAQQSMPSQAFGGQMPSQAFSGQAPQAQQGLPSQVPIGLPTSTVGGAPTGGAPMPVADGDAMMYAGGTPGFDFNGGAKPVAPVGLPPVSPIPKLSLGSAPAAGSTRTPRTPAY